MDGKAHRSGIDACVTWAVTILALTISTTQADLIQFFRSDNTYWRIGTAFSETRTPQQLNPNLSKLGGGLSNVYQGHTYTITPYYEPPYHNRLTMDGTNHIAALDGVWYTPQVPQNNYGLAIDHNGLGWLITTDDNDGCSMLFTLNITTGHLDYIDYVGGRYEGCADLFQVVSMKYYPALLGSAEAVELPQAN